MNFYKITLSPRRHLRALAFALGALMLLPFVAHAAEAPEASPALESTIRQVTVYSDRARVMREASVDVGTSSQTVAFEKLPGWVDEASVRVALSPPSAGRIVDVHVKRGYLAQAGDANYQSAQAEVVDLQGQIAALDDELRILAAQSKQIEAVKVFSLERAAKSDATADVSVDRYGKVVDYVTRSMRQTAAAMREVRRNKAQLQPQLAAHQRRLNELKGLTQLEETAVHVTLAGPKSASATLQLTYMLPGATWQPAHELRADGPDPKSAELTSYAVVTQTTGEDWSRAELSFSTQSSQQRTRIPQLQALKLGNDIQATRVLESRMSSFRRASSAYKGQNRLWNKWQRKGAMQDHTSKRMEQVYESNVRLMETVQSKTVQIFESLQNRGTSAHFEGQRRLTIRADGQAVRVPLGAVTLGAHQRIVAAPEQTLNAARTIDMRNSSGRALLPGPVALYQDGAFLGMTDLDFVAEGEQFSMFLGVADQIKLSRVLDKKHSSVRRPGTARKRKTRMKVAWLVTVENLSAHPVLLDLSDRVPVSENREIRVDQVRIEPGAKPDSKGLLGWKVALEPGDSRVYRIQYRLEYPPSLVLRTRRRSKNAARPAADAPIEEKIMSLEAEL